MLKSLQESFIFKSGIENCFKCKLHTYRLYKWQKCLDHGKKERARCLSLPLKFEDQLNSDEGSWKLASGYGHSLVWNKTCNMLLGEGLNFYGQLGFGYDLLKQRKVENKTDELSYVDSLTDIKLKTTNDIGRLIDVACGRAHSLLITSQSVLGSGLNTHGQCGMHEDRHNLTTFEKLELNYQIKQVSCGFDHSLLLTTDGDVFATGLGADGQTGLGTLDCQFGFKKVTFPERNTRIYKVAAGADTSLALSENGNIYGWGNNEYRQISNEDVAQIPYPAPIKVGLADDICDVACGGTFICLLTCKGSIYVRGFAPFIEKEESTKTGLRYCGTAEDVKYSRVKCGADYITLLADNNCLMTYGRPGHLGIGSTKANVLYQGIQQKQIIDFACGVEHILLLVLKESG